MSLYGVWAKETLQKLALDHITKILLQQGADEVTINAMCYIRSGFYLGGKRILIGSYVKFRSPLWLLHDYSAMWTVSYPQLPNLDLLDDESPIEFFVQVEAVFEIVGDLPSSSFRYWASL